MDNDESLIQLHDKLQLSQTERHKQKNILRHQLSNRAIAKAKQKFVGTLLWDFLDVLTFGSLEKPKQKKHHQKPQPAEKNETVQEEAIKTPEKKPESNKKAEQKQLAVVPQTHQQPQQVHKEPTPQKKNKSDISDEIQELKKEVIKTDIMKETDDQLKLKKSVEAEEKLNKENSAKKSAESDDDDDNEEIVEDKPTPKAADPLETKIAIEKAALDVKKEVLPSKVPTTEHVDEEANKDPIITYLSLISAHHSSKLDRQYVESVFDSYSSAPKENKDDTSLQTGESEGEADLAEESERIVTKANTILAYQEIFQMWKVDLSAEQQKQVQDVYFPQVWLKYGEHGILNQKDSYRFIKDLMTTHSKKDKTAETAPIIPTSTSADEQVDEDDDDDQDDTMAQKKSSSQDKTKKNKNKSKDTTKKKKKSSKKKVKSQNITQKPENEESTDVQEDVANMSDELYIKKLKETQSLMSENKGNHQFKGLHAS